MPLQAPQFLIFARPHLQETRFSDPPALHVNIQLNFCSDRSLNCALLTIFPLKSHFYVCKPHRGRHIHTSFFFFYCFTLQKKVVISKVYDGSYSKAECDVTQQFSREGLISVVEDIHVDRHNYPNWTLARISELTEKGLLPWRWHQITNEHGCEVPALSCWKAQV